MTEVSFDPKLLVKKLDELTKIQIPLASRKALNKALFDTRQRLRDQSKQVFQNPVPFTVNSFLYRKPVESGKDLLGSVYVRDDAPRGNAPSRYLNPQIRGGPTYRTRFQKALGYTPDPDPQGFGGPILAPNRVMVPTNARGVRRNKFGNMSNGQYTQILSALRNASSADNPSLGIGRKAKKGKASKTYFFLNRESLEERNFRNTTPGIFLRRPAGSISRVMTETKLYQHRAKFNFFDISKNSITKFFPKYLRENILS